MCPSKQPTGCVDISQVQYFGSQPNLFIGMRTEDFSCNDFFCAGGVADDSAELKIPGQLEGQRHPRRKNECVVASCSAWVSDELKIGYKR